MLHAFYSIFLFNACGAFLVMHLSWLFYKIVIKNLMIKNPKQNTKENKIMVSYAAAQAYIVWVHIEFWWFGLSVVGAYFTHHFI